MALATLVVTMAVYALLRWQAPLIAVAAVGPSLVFVIYLREAGVHRNVPLRHLVPVAVLAVILGVGWVLLTGATVAESHDVAAIVDAVTDYVARRMIEREHALVATPAPEPVVVEPKRRSGFWTFVLGFLAGAIALFGLALFATLRNL